MRCMGSTTSTEYVRLDFASRDHEEVSYPWFWLLHDLYYEDHVDFNVNEGHRTMERQAELVREKGVWSSSNPTGAARPSPSAPHIRTGRVDHACDFDNAVGVMVAAGERGVTLRQTIMPFEPWHLEADAAELVAYAKKDRHAAESAAHKTGRSVGGATAAFAKPGVSRPAQIAAAHGLGFAEIAVQEGAAAGIPVALAFAMLEQESGGRNVYGHDAVRNPAVKGGPVTKANYAAYKADRKRGLGMQGVGPLQLTWWATQDKADAMGGCWRPRINIRCGFQTLKADIDAHGEVAGIAAYNGSGPKAAQYSLAVRAKRDAWAAVLRAAK